MRGPDIQQDALFSMVSPEARVPKDHPLRPIRTMVDAALKEMDQDFNALYAASGRDSIRATGPWMPHTAFLTGLSGNITARSF